MEKTVPQIPLDVPPPIEETEEERLLRERKEK